MKKLFAVLTFVILCVVACSRESLTIPEPVTINTETLKEYVLPPKLNRTLINVVVKEARSFRKKDANLLMPPPLTHCEMFPDDCQLWDTIIFNGKDQINVVFVADGWVDYINNDEDVGVLGYNMRVDSLIASLLDYTPFDDREEDFNFFTYRTIPNSTPFSDGMSVHSHPTNSEVEDIITTPWNVFRNYAGLPRYTHISDDDRDRLYDSLIQPPTGYLKNKKIYAVILSAGETFAGSGEFDKQFAHNQKLVVSIISKSTEAPFGGLMQNLFIHEWGGHSIGDQDDEYVDSLYAANAPTYDAVVWDYDDRENVTADTINDRKWDAILIPPFINYIQGARYVDDKYRSTEANMMRFINTQFSELNRILIDWRIDDEL